MALAECRGAKQPSEDALDAYVSSLSGFTEEATMRAFEHWTEAPAREFGSQMPSVVELVESCRQACVKKTRWCGRCTMGMVRQGKEWVRCDCNCPECDNSGWISVMRPVYGLPYKEASFAQRCPKGCAVRTEAA
jgi:hypothetical protein